MMDIQMLNIVIRSVFALTAIWVIWYYGLREYLLDNVRQSLFGIRDKLFDYAADGNIDFNDPAYGNLRLLLNGMIRFAHQLTPGRLLLTFAIQTVRPNPVAPNILSKHMAPIRNLPPDKQAVLTQLHIEMIVAVSKYAALRSPVLLLVFGFLWLWCAIKAAFSNVTNAFAICLKPLVGLLEAQAIESESDHRRKAVA